MGFVDLAKLEALASLNDEDAIFSLANYYQDKNDYKKSFSYLSRIVNTKNSEYLRKIGFFFEKGLGVEKDSQTAFSYYLKSANLGDGISQYNVSLCYLNGIGTPKDEHNAFSYALLSFNNNYPKSALLLSTFYKNGVGTPVNPDKALDTLDKNSSWDASTYYIKAVLLLNTSCKSFNPSLAVECLKKAIDLGSFDAYGLLGEMTVKGTMVTKEPEKGIGYLLKAAKGGNKKAMLVLSDCYKSGLGVNTNIDISNFWLEQYKKKNH